MIYFELFLTFFKIGLFTFGGGYAMLTMIQQEVMAHNWMSLNEITDFVAVSESTPGPLAINMATFIGMHTSGILGALCATFGVVFPSFVVILIIAHIFEKFKKNAYVNAAMGGIKPAVVGLIGSALLTTIISSFGSFSLSLNYLINSAVLLIMAVLVFIFRKRIHPIILIVVCAILGIVFGSLGIIKI